MATNASDWALDRHTRVCKIQQITAFLAHIEGKDPQDRSLHGLAKKFEDQMFKAAMNVEDYSSRINKKLAKVQKSRQQQQQQQQQQRQQQLTGLSTSSSETPGAAAALAAAATASWLGQYPAAATDTTLSSSSGSGWSGGGEGGRGAATFQAQLSAGQTWTGRGLSGPGVDAATPSAANLVPSAAMGFPVPRLNSMGGSTGGMVGASSGMTMPAGHAVVAPANQDDAVLMSQRQRSHRAQELINIYQEDVRCFVQHGSILIKELHKTRPAFRNSEQVLKLVQYVKEGQNALLYINRINDTGHVPSAASLQSLEHKLIRVQKASDALEVKIRDHSKTQNQVNTLQHDSTGTPPPSVPRKYCGDDLSAVSPMFSQSNSTLRGEESAGGVGTPVCGVGEIPGSMGTGDTLNLIPTRRQ